MPLPAIAIGAKLLGIRKALAKVPWWVWGIIALIVLGVVGAWWHGNRVEAFGSERYAAGAADERARIAAQERRLIAAAHKLKKDAESLQAAANQAIGAQYDEAVAGDRARVDALRRMQPPGQARCGAVTPGRDGAGMAGGSAAAPPAANGPDLAGLAVVPWQPLVGHGERCAVLERQVTGWNDWYDRQKVIWNEWQAKAEAARRSP